MINLISGFILVLFSNYDSMTVVNPPNQYFTSYGTLENCKEAGLVASAQSRYQLYYVCVPDVNETEKND